MTLKLKGGGMIKNQLTRVKDTVGIVNQLIYLTVEDEFHFLMECPLCNSESTVLLNKVYEMFRCMEKLS